MYKTMLCLLLAAFTFSLAAQAQEKKTAKVKVKATVEVEIDLDDVTALSEVPNTLDAAREAGSTETEIHKGYGAMKTIYIKGQPSLKIANHFKSQAVLGLNDEGLGDLIRQCLDDGFKDEALVKCVVGKTKVKKAKPQAKIAPINKAVFLKGNLATSATDKPAKLEKEADNVGEPTGALEGKKVGPLKKK